jgi:hypothetical protein
MPEGMESVPEEAGEELFGARKPPAIRQNAFAGIHMLIFAGNNQQDQVK